MSTWFLPSYTGDFRLISVDASSYRDQTQTGSVLEIVNPAVHEIPVLKSFLAEARRQKWTIIDKVAPRELDGQLRQEILLSVDVGTAGAALYKLVRPADRTITAVRSVAGKIDVYETADLDKVAEALSPPSPTPETADASAAEPDGAVEPDGIIKPKRGRKKTSPTDEPSAVSVKRPTPSCPQCVPGVTSRASEVLNTFLTPDERYCWARDRYIIIKGGLSGHRYMLAHRHSTYAVKAGRICYDLDDDFVVHFHDNSVPPEEEVLAAKLILQHREPWLRNEATCLGPSPRPRQLVFKNPFGGVLDGVDEAIQTQVLGSLLRSM